MKMRSLVGFATWSELGRSLARPCSDDGFGAFLPMDTKICPVSWIEMKVGGLALASGGGAFAGGRSMRIEVVARGATTMKMISSTSMTSTNGVTFMSLFW